jgi:hypothetical protein
MLPFVHLKNVGMLYSNNGPAAGDALLYIITRSRNISRNRIKITQPRSTAQMAHAK